MTNLITSSRVPTGASPACSANARPIRPVKLVEHPAFRTRLDRANRPTASAALAAIRVVSLHAGTSRDSRARIAATSGIGADCIVGAA